MTIYNQVNNISDDYTFVLNTDELFYTKEEMPCGVFEYNVSNQTWTETRKTSNAFDTKYENAKNFVKTYYQSILDIINPETKYSDLLTEIGAGNGLFIGIQMDSIEGFPQLNDNQYFIIIISSSLKMCIPVKSFVLYSNTRIIESNDEELNDLEYLSAKQCLNLIYNAISKVEILQIVDELPTQPSDIKTNCVYLLYEENNQSQDEIDDGLNFHFTLWVYSKTDEEFKQVDRLTFDIKNYALKNHTHGQINNNGTIGNTAGIPLITGTNGIVTVGTFGSSSSTTATDFVSCADTRLSDSRTPKTHASTATTYGVGTETKYGHNKVINGLTASSYQNGESLSAYQGKVLNDTINDVASRFGSAISNLEDELEFKVDKAVVSGGTNILKGDPVNTSGTSTTGSNYTIESDLYHGNKIYHRDETSYETSKYGDLQWIVLPDEFTYGDVFTLSFYAKGTSGKEIRTYFYGESGYVNVKRIASNSTQDSTPSSSFHDGATRFTLTSDWKHYYVTYQLNTTGTLTVNKKLCIRVYGGTDCYISNVQLERGDNVTDYRPNVMDELNNRALVNYVQKSNTTGLLKNDGSVMTSGTGSSNYAIGNHTHDEYLRYNSMAYVFKIPYSIEGTATNFNVSSYLYYIWTVDMPLFIFVKNTIGDNVANATLKFKRDGSDITILDANNSMQPIQAGVWKKDTWALFFCYAPSTVQLQGIFYDTTAIDTLINNSNANTGTSIDVVDNLTTNDGLKALSAKQGKILNDNKAPVIHSHNISDITNLDTALNDKEDVLVSGYNIKTINNESILGSGNLTIQNEDNYYLYMDGDELVLLITEDEQIATTIQIIWNDNNNASGLRPAQVTGTLSNGESFALSDSNNWTTTVYRPKYVNGQGVLYTWSISTVLGYTTTSSTDNNVTTFTNTYRTQPPAPE